MYSGQVKILWNYRIRITITRARCDVSGARKGPKGERGERGRLLMGSCAEEGTSTGAVAEASERGGRRETLIVAEGPDREIRRQCTTSTMLIGVVRCLTMDGGIVGLFSVAGTEDHIFKACTR